MAGSAGGVNKLARYTIVAVSIAVVGYLLWLFHSIVWYIITAMVVSLMGRPLVLLLGRMRFGRFRCPTSVGAAIALVTIFAFFGVLFWLFFPLITKQFEVLRGVDLNEILRSASEPLAVLDAQIAELIPSNAESFSILDAIQQQANSLLDAELFRNVFSSTASFLTEMLVAIFSVAFIAYFFMKEDGLFLRGLTFFFPERYEENIRHAVSRSESLLRRYFIGLAIESVIITILTVIGMLVLRLSLNTALVIGVLAGVLNVIPYVGALISLGIAMIIPLAMYTAGSVPMGIGKLLLLIAVVFIAIRFLDNFLLQPYIYSSSAHAHPLEIFIVLLMAGSLAGMLGMFLAIPVYTIARVVGKEFFNNFHLVQRLTKNI